ncbi:MAG: ADP-ribosylglycohydrolase family protein [Victivallales bacterium]|nr:ADP-ribosylglycohydrolase family protein [Victivallales bacterium]
MDDNMPTKFKSSKAVGAILGAACGDALGWPNERVGKSNTPKQPQGRLHEFKKWTRRSGSHFYPYEEIIEAGEYSDDTQLILCLSRSLLKGEKWFEFYTQIELPFWYLYERGGGGATKRAVDSWLDGIEPWNPNRKQQDVKRYFDAGGNGVAMRALPHALYLSEADFNEVATSIFWDGITTHGHPRALLGALVYGYALWVSLRKDTKLGYGELIEEIITNEAVWASIPADDNHFSEWMSQAQKHLNDYKNIWLSTKDEILKYLEICKLAFSKGALSFDDDALEKLQCYSKQISGAGTVAAVASIYLASRYAADPLNGVIKAAFAIGSDTDTIASMAGGLLGCINSSDWLSSVKSEIQDCSYLEKTALKLSTRQTESMPSFEPVKRTALKNWTDDVVSAPDSSKVKLPDGRIAKVYCGQDQIGRSGKYKVEFRRFVSSEGQTIYINKISKGNSASQQRATETVPPAKQVTLNQAQGAMQTDRLNLGFKLPVASIEKSVWFYKELLGLTIKKQSKDVVVFYQGLVLVPASYGKELQSQGFRSLLYVEVTDIHNRYHWIIERGIQVITPLECWGQSKRCFFRCYDLDGNLIEVFEKQ